MGMQQKWRRFKNDVTIFLLHIPGFQYLTEILKTAYDNPNNNQNPQNCNQKLEH